MLQVVAVENVAAAVARKPRDHLGRFVALQVDRVFPAGIMRPWRPSRALPDPLSAQEERVLGMLVRGYSYQEIAGELVVSVNTVKTHVKGVYRKLNVNRRREARELAQRLGLA